jgi:hypothetical protein
VEEESFTRNTETGEIDAKKEDVLMLVDGHSASAKALLEAQLLKLRPKFSTELFAEYTKDVITHDEVILWAKASTTNENAGE